MIYAFIKTRHRMLPVLQVGLFVPERISFLSWPPFVDWLTAVQVGGSNVQQYKEYKNNLLILSEKNLTMRMVLHSSDVIDSEIFRRSSSSNKQRDTSSTFISKGTK